MLSLDNYNDASRLIDGNFDDPRLTDYELLLENLRDLKEGKDIQVSCSPQPSCAAGGVRLLRRAHELLLDMPCDCKQGKRISMAASLAIGVAECQMSDRPFLRLLLLPGDSTSTAPPQVPIYDFKVSKRVGYKTVKVPVSRVVIVEGIYALSARIRWGNLLLLPATDAYIGPP